MQGLIYNHFLGTAFEGLHDKHGYKFFSFSNIFVPNSGKAKREFKNEIREGEKCNWIMASPSHNLINTLKDKFAAKIGNLEKVSVGGAEFRVVCAKPVNARIGENALIKSATPIVVRIPQGMYANYSLQSELSYLYWRPEMDFNAFIKQLEENLFKKYNEYNGTAIEKFPLFEAFRFKKATTSQIVEEGRDIPMHGSIWEFQFSALTNMQRKILEFGMDCGFGERNTLGFGFVNVMRGQ